MSGNSAESIFQQLIVDLTDITNASRPVVGMALGLVGCLTEPGIVC
ncbi:hypothetical protein SAMN05421830_11750 [Desulfomicrobium norvegicum]|uniref:Uncharacterized protein n=1 Tax=Desulfomicrobium norvegicum (strain DSM 1741 / NCIMB 8310) TaxID=52561 RepID=A0A8G2C5U8_DESNO|nr:hypothetical protein SAMN05421830_11750 [Desulfomicrobium norvegicum]